VGIAWFQNVEIVLADEFADTFARPPQKLSSGRPGPSESIRVVEGEQHFQLLAAIDLSNPFNQMQIVAFRQPEESSQF